jgi:acylphosphatase
MKHVNIKIHGKVQGVFYRQSAQNKAGQLGVVGWAGNENDGSVYIEAEGSQSKLKEFLDWCRQGPSAASVSEVEYEFTDDLQGFQGFEIKY